MANRYTELSLALLAQLTTLVDDPDVVIERRLLLRRDRTEFAHDKTYVSIFAGDAEFAIRARQVDDENRTAVVAIQALGPEPEPAAGDNAFARVTEAESDPVSWGDTVFDFVEQVKGYWRGETPTLDAGPLRDLQIAGCRFMSLTNSPVYIPAHLAEQGILSVPLTLTYKPIADL